MTPEQMAANCLLGAAFKTPEAADDALVAIATALREARNQGLEEAAALVRSWHDKQTSQFLAFNVRQEISALKHKDGQS